MAISYSSMKVVSFPFGTKCAHFPIVDIPSGYTLCKAKFRDDSFPVCFLRSGKSFSKWHLEFADRAKTTLRPWRQIAVNAR